MPTNKYKKKYTVSWKKRIEKSIQKMPEADRKKFPLLVRDLEEKGPIRKEWPNFSPVGDNTYHCHLSYHWIACWFWRKKTIEIEVIYVGSREKAPY